jgi:hypothetical protein
LVPTRQSPVPERVTDFKQWLLAQAGMTPTFA